MTKLTAFLLIWLTTPVLSSEPVSFTINTKKWSHVLDDHFISITVNPTDLLQGKVYGLAMNSTMAILKGLAPAYVRIGSADTAKYTFKRNRYPSDVVKPDDEYTVTETHWIVFNEVAQQAGLDVIVCLNAAHRSEGTKKWDTRNSLELISFSDSQGYNLTWQLGYEVQAGQEFSGIQFGKDLNRLRTILNAFPRYQHAKLIGPDIRVIHKKEDIDFWNDVLIEAGPTLDAVTWHPRWPQPSKMKVSDDSDLGYEFPIDYLEWDRSQLSKILQKSIFKNPVWIGETKSESTGTFAEGLIWARRLVLAAKLGVEVVMKHPNLMDITHPKPEYWIALLHKRLLGKSVLETRSVGNSTDLIVVSHCTNPSYWSDKPEKLQDGPITVFGVNMGSTEQKIQIKGTWTGKSQLMFQYVLTSGSDPDSVFSQMTYLNGEPLMMTDDGMLPDIIPKIKKLERGVTLKLPPYSLGFWVLPEAKVKICQIHHHDIPVVEAMTSSGTVKSAPKTLENIRDINQFLVEKLKNPESDSEEVPEVKIEEVSSESSEKDLPMLSKENNLPRVARKIRQVNGMDELNQQIKTIMQETQAFLSSTENAKNINNNRPKAAQSMETRIQGLAEGISDAIKTTDQQHEFNKFLEEAGLKQDFGSLLMNDQNFNSGMKSFQPYFHSQNPEGRLDEFEVKERMRRSITMDEDYSQEDGIEDEDDSFQEPIKIKKIVKEEPNKNQKPGLIIPHQPDLKGLEEKYKEIVNTKIKDGKRKIDDIKKKIKQDEIKNPDIHEEIIKKEIELIQKTEETVADILKSQKKRQENFEDIIFEELNDVKDERIRELQEINRNNKKNSIVKRQAQTPLAKPLLKTVEYIEKNFNLEPESVRKIKRSLEERMGEILRNYDAKKSSEIKKQRSVPVREERKIRKPDTERRHETRYEPEHSKDKNVIKKTSSQSHHRKNADEPTPRSRKSEEMKKKYVDDENDSFELFNEKKLEEPVRKSTRRQTDDKKPVKKSSTKYPQREDEAKEKIEEAKTEKVKEVEKKKKPQEEPTEPTPLKNDKDRREDMLKQITILVDKMNSKERTGNKLGFDDEDISEEFESERRPHKVKRRPREADMYELLKDEKVKNDKIDIPINETPVQPTATPKVSKKKRNRQNRRRKEMKKEAKEEMEESQQMKRHLGGIDNPIQELEKKKILKPKLRKLNPKFRTTENELLNKEVVPAQPENPLQEIPIVPPETPMVMTEPSIIDQSKQLMKDLEDIVEEKVFLEQDSSTLKKKLKTNGKDSSKEEDNQSEETPEPTEGFIIVEPTEDFDDIVTEKTKLKEDSPIKKTDEALMKDNKIKIVKIKSFEDETEEKEGNASLEKKSMESTESSEEEIMTKFEKSDKTGIENSQRRRRATFLANHGEDDEENDYSSEERIQKFKQMIYRKSPTKKPIKNEVRSTASSGMGMGADEFLRMAGSTVRVMFDDVIPEAYGQTKNKIQNMGISEYINEFSKIVQQMKNLDKIFLNIGEAAVKGYIRGNKAEKGPYIQVISRKKRQIEKDDSSEADSRTEMPNTDPNDQTATITDQFLTVSPEPDGTTEGSRQYGRTGTEEESIVPGQRPDRENARQSGTSGGEHGKSLREDDKTRGMETTEGAPVTPSEKTETSEASQGIENSPDASTKEKVKIPDDLQERIFTPWIKTTKDFIQQALTTLKRQRELSDILTNDLMNREITKKTIGKRDIAEEDPKLPVFYMVPPKGANKKREAQQQESDESLIRHLRGLRPGVYVVPTEEMTNIRSEQITNEAKQKSGMPNVVTLNIYYDKKNSEISGKADSATQTPEVQQAVGQDAVTYYQNKAWNAATAQYNQNNQYLTVPDVNMAAPVNPAVQTQTVFTADPSLPNSRLIQYPPSYHYPPVPKVYPAIVPNPQSVFGPVYYLPQENRYIQPPGTKRQWREFKARSAGLPIGTNLGSGWNIQYEVPQNGNSPKIAPSSYNKNYKVLIQDKKRSIGGSKIDPTWSEAALPFWKFFSTSERKNKMASESNEDPEKESAGSAESTEDLFVENRKRAKGVEKVTPSSVEKVTEEKLPEEEAGEEEKSRRRRSTEPETRNIFKRSYPYQVEFRDHDILPEWFGTYQEVDNALDSFPAHTRRSHIISTPWSDEDEELLNILEADDELTLAEMSNDDYYFPDDNSIQHLRRYPRSTDQFDNNLIKSNMIYKMPMDENRLKPKTLGMMGMKKLTDEDSSLELMNKLKPPKTQMQDIFKPFQFQKPPQQPLQFQQFLNPQQFAIKMAPQLTTAQPSLNLTQIAQNGTILLPRNPHDDTFYYFFKYAYDSLVKVMKSMTELF